MTLSEFEEAVRKLCGEVTTTGGWKDIAVLQPKHGQHIIACNVDLNSWEEIWGSEEPIGSTRWWIEAPKIVSDKYCVTDASGECVSNDPRCMHNPAVLEKQDQVAWTSDPARVEMTFIGMENTITSLHEQLATVTAERDELKATIGYEAQYKKAYIELSGKTGELEGRITEIRNILQKAKAERDHYNRDRNIWVRSNKQLQEQLAAVTNERDELKSCIDNDRELFDVPVFTKQLETKLVDCVAALKEYVKREEGEGFFSSTAHKALAKVTGSPALSASPRGLPGYAGDNNGD